MCEWVWFAGLERLKHLAMMRRSAASVRFARFNIFLLALGLGFVQATRYGWRWVTASTALDPYSDPGGIGWFHVARTPPHEAIYLAPENTVNLWWNPLQAGIAVATGVVATLVVAWIALWLLRLGVTRAHRPRYHLEQRMTAALHYGTAWSVPVLVGTLVACLRPVSFIGAVQHWAWYPPVRFFELIAAVIVGLGLALWWFWLLRVAATARAPTRRRVVVFLTIGAPAIACGGTALWCFGLDRLHELLFASLGVMF